MRIPFIEQIWFMVCTDPLHIHYYKFMSYKSFLNFLVALYGTAHTENSVELNPHKCVFKAQFYIWTLLFKLSQ